MKKNWATLLAVFLVTGFLMKSAAQQCGAPAPVISIYYPVSAGIKYGLGLEAGHQGVDGPVGIFGGFYFQSLSAGAIRKDSDSTGKDKFQTAFYLKGLLRLTRTEGVASLYLVAAPQLDGQSKMDFRSGLRLMFPLGEKRGLGIEPVYSVKQKSLTVNLLMAF
jgi:hypothetical protein